MFVNVRKYAKKEKLSPDLAAYIDQSDDLVGNCLELHSDQSVLTLKYPSGIIALRYEKVSFSSEKKFRLYAAYEDGKMAAEWFDFPGPCVVRHSNGGLMLYHSPCNKENLAQGYGYLNNVEGTQVDWWDFNRPNNQSHVRRRCAVSHCLGFSLDPKSGLYFYFNMTGGHQYQLHFGYEATLSNLKVAHCGWSFLTANMNNIEVPTERMDIEIAKITERIYKWQRTEGRIPEPVREYWDKWLKTQGKKMEELQDILEPCTNLKNVPKKTKKKLRSGSPQYTRPGGGGSRRRSFSRDGAQSQSRRRHSIMSDDFGGGFSYTPTLVQRQVAKQMNHPIEDSGVIDDRSGSDNDDKAGDDRAGGDRGEGDRAAGGDREVTNGRHSHRINRNSSQEVIATKIDEDGRSGPYLNGSYTDRTGSHRPTPTTGSYTDRGGSERLDESVHRRGDDNSDVSRVSSHKLPSVSRIVGLQSYLQQENLNKHKMIAGYIGQSKDQKADKEDAIQELLDAHEVSSLLVGVHCPNDDVIRLMTARNQPRTPPIPTVTEELTPFSLNNSPYADNSILFDRLNNKSPHYTRRYLVEDERRTFEDSFALSIDEESIIAPDLSEGWPLIPTGDTPTNDNFKANDNLVAKENDAMSPPSIAPPMTPKSPHINPSTSPQPMSPPSMPPPECISPVPSDNPPVYTSPVKSYNPQMTTIIPPLMINNQYMPSSSPSIDGQFKFMGSWSSVSPLMQSNTRMPPSRHHRLSVGGQATYSNWEIPPQLTGNLLPHIHLLFRGKVLQDPLTTRILDYVQQNLYPFTGMLLPLYYNTMISEPL
eukprot:GHVL01010290.1.p1 GENE.GHVL01010290.1~~GHVL01010290.1.p1  ORF type:complete len:815 (+),score=149.82 GHVL01010290.1:35-2479(+)